MARVFVYAADRAGCGYYRCKLPGRALAAAGYDVTVFEPDDDGYLEALVVGRNKAALLTSIPDCDVAVIQRPIDWTWSRVIGQLQHAGIRVIGEIDDDVRAVHAAHAAYAAMHPRYNPRHNWDHCAKAMALCDRVTVTTLALEHRYATNGNGVVLPNCVPADFIVDTPDVRAVDVGDLIVGWPGKVASHPGDLDATEQAVGRLQRRAWFRMRVIGSGDGVKRGLALPIEPEVISWVPMESYGDALSALDIGIAPLGATAFNEAKSFLKPLELSARGVPFVCSPSSPYREFCASGAGLVAQGRREWTAALIALFDPSVRMEIAQAGLTAARRWTIEEHLDDWVKAWWVDE